MVAPVGPGAVGPGAAGPGAVGPGAAGPGAAGPGAAGPGAAGPGAAGPGAAGPGAAGPGAAGPGAVGPGAVGPGAAGPGAAGPGAVGPGAAGPGAAGPGAAGPAAAGPTPVLAPTAPSTAAPAGGLTDAQQKAKAAQEEQEKRDKFQKESAGYVGYKMGDVSFERKDEADPEFNLRTSISSSSGLIRLLPSGDYAKHGVVGTMTKEEQKILIRWDKDSGRASAILESLKDWDDPAKRWAATKSEIDFQRSQGNTSLVFDFGGDRPEEKIDWHGDFDMRQHYSQQLSELRERSLRILIDKAIYSYMTDTSFKLGPKAMELLNSLTDKEKKIMAEYEMPSRDSKITLSSDGRPVLTGLRDSTGKLVLFSEMGFSKIQKEIDANIVKHEMEAKIVRDIGYTHCKKNIEEPPKAPAPLPAKQDNDFTQQAKKPPQMTEVDEGKRKQLQDQWLDDVHGTGEAEVWLATPEGRDSMEKFIGTLESRLKGIEEGRSHLQGSVDAYADMIVDPLKYRLENADIVKLVDKFESKDMDNRRKDLMSVLDKKVGDSVAATKGELGIELERWQALAQKQKTNLEAEKAALPAGTKFPKDKEKQLADLDKQLDKLGNLTSRCDAERNGVTSLSARITAMKKDGHDLKDDIQNNRKAFKV